MVYKYVRKTSQGSWNENDMEKAIQEAALGTLNSVSLQYNIPYATLYRHVKKRSFERKLGRFSIVFHKEQEEQLVKYLKFMDSLFYGLPRAEFKEVVHNFEQKNAIPHPSQNAAAGDEWLVGFICRHPDITLRSPEPTSVARNRGFSRPQATRFYTLLSELI
jgi:hypothetical protein